MVGGMLIYLLLDLSRTGDYRLDHLHFIIGIIVKKKEISLSAVYC